MVSLCLKVNVQQNLDKESPSVKDVNANDSKRCNSAKEGPGGLSSDDYESAIQTAAMYGTIETLNMLIKASHDGVFGPDCDNIGQAVLGLTERVPTPVETSYSSELPVQDASMWPNSPLTSEPAPVHGHTHGWVPGQL